MPMSLRAYALRRGDVTEGGVRKAIRDGRLSESLVFVETKTGKRVQKIADPDLADREWARNTRSQTTDVDPDAPDPDIDFNEARRRKEVELWRQAVIKREVDALELEVRRGELIPVDEARATVIDAYTIVRTKLLGVPARCGQRMPELSTEDVALIEDLIREALEELADADAA